MMKKRTRFVVKIIVEEKLPMTNYSQELNIYNMNFTSDKYHCDCEGLQNEIRELLWEPYSAKFFTGGRYFKSALVKNLALTKRMVYSKISASVEKFSLAQLKWGKINEFIY